jgi:hypothetical protein
MSVRDKNYVWTTDAMTLDDELREKVNPIIEKAIASGMEIEDVYYIMSMYLDEALTNIVLQKARELRNKTEVK